MSLICGCAGSQSSPKHRGNMSKIKQPGASAGNSRFGFNRASTNNRASLSSSVNHESNGNCKPDQPPSRLSNGLTLSPASLLENSIVDEPPQSPASYVQRKPSSTSNKPRPLSSIVTISSSDDVPEEENFHRTVDDTNTSGKPKSGLRSFLSRPFSRNSTPQTPKANGKTISGSKSYAGTDKSKLSTPTTAAGQSQRKSLSQSKLATPGRCSPTSHSRSSPTKLSHPSQSKLSLKPESTNSNSAAMNVNKSKASRSETASSIDSSRSMGTRENGHISSAAVQSSSSSEGLLHKTSSSNTSHTDKKTKPTIEICPLAKPELDESKEDKTQCEGAATDMGIGTTKRFSPATPSSRKYQVDEAALNSMLSEVVMLRSALTELQHHLMGKQEHEEKMREELKQKNDIISALHNQLAHCSCASKTKDLIELKLENNAQAVES